MNYVFYLLTVVNFALLIFVVRELLYSEYEDYSLEDYLQDKKFNKWLEGNESATKKAAPKKNTIKSEVKPKRGRPVGVKNGQGKKAKAANNKPVKKTRR